eukprot:1769736-Rhodomonas_salina.1
MLFHSDTSDSSACAPPSQGPWHVVKPIQELVQGWGCVRAETFTFKVSLDGDIRTATRQSSSSTYLVVAVALVVANRVVGRRRPDYGQC